MKSLDPTSDSPKHKWPPNPYPGLRPFLITEDSDESLIFFGRREQIHDLLDRLGNTHFMAVLGPSGCGKSSLVKAGLIPALDSGLIYHAGANWISAEAEPGSAPINNLAKAIADALSGAQRADAGDKVPTAEVLAERMYASTTALVDLAEELPGLVEDNTNLLVLVDQFEEIFREDLAQRDEDAQLINLLLNVFNMRPEGLYVVITMRTDYLEQCATFHGLPEALNQSQYLTPRLNPQQLSDSITGPAELRHYGGKVEPKLARKILSEMTSSSGYDPDLLPLMQHALFWMWRQAQKVERAEGEPVLLTLELYQELAGDGGLQGVLSRRADDIFENALNEEQQRIAECMFRLMSEVDDGARRRRRVTTPDEVAAIADVSLQEARAVIDIFASDTVSFIRWKDNGKTLDVTHESLIRKWERFDAWALEERSDAEQYRDLERATEKWAEDNRATLTEAGLLRWEEFQQRKGNVKRWAARYGDGFEGVSEYLKVSKTRVEEYKARQQQFQEATEREKAAKQKMSLLMGAAAVVLVVAAVGFLGWKTSFDQNKVLIKNEQDLKAKSEELARQAAQLKKKSDEATEQREKADLARGEAVQAQRAALVAQKAAEDAQDEAEEARGEAEAEAIQLKESSERNARLVQLSKRAITLRRAAIVEREVDEGRPATALRLALDTKDIATKDDQAFHLALARAATAAPQPGVELIGRFGGVSSVLWREEVGGWAALWQSGAIGPLERPNQLIRPFPLTTAQNYVSGGLSPDGQQVLATTQSGTTVLIGAGETGQPIKLTHNRGEAVEAQFTDDGTVFAMLSKSKKLSVWEAEAGDLLAHLDLLDVDAFDLNQDGTLLVTVSPIEDENDVQTASRISLWALQPNAVFASRLEVSGVVTVLRLSPDESSIAVGLKDGTLKLLAADGSSVRELGRHKNAVAAIAFDPASPRLGSGGASGELHVWNLETGQRQAANRAAVSRQNIRRLEFSPDGRSLLVGSKYVIQVLDPANLTVQNIVHSDERPVALSADGSRVLSRSRNGATWLWDVSTGARISSIKAPSPALKTGLVVFSLDGTQVATTYENGAIQISSARDGRSIRVLTGQPRQIRSLAFNADGTRLVVRSMQTGTRQTRLDLLDSETGAVLLTENQPRTADHGFSPDGKWFFAQMATDTIRVWNAVTGELLNDVAVPKANFKRSLLFLKNGTSGTSADVRLITLERRKTRLWDVSSGDVVNQFSPHARGNLNLAINADATVLMTLSREQAHLFNLRVQPSSRLIRPMARARGKRLSVGVFDKDGGSNFALFSARVYRAYGSGRTRRLRRPLWTMTYWTTESRTGSGQRGRQTAVRVVQQSEVFGTVRFSHEALSWQSPRHVIALTSVDGRVQTWRVRRGNRSHALDGQHQAVGPLKGPSWVEFDNNDRLIVRSRDGLKTYQIAKGDGAPSENTWKDMQTIKSTGRGLIADLSPDGKFVALPVGKTSPVVVKLETGEQFGVRTPETGPTFSAVFDKSGRKILTTHGAGVARLWSFDPAREEIKLLREFASQSGKQGQLQSGYFDSTGDKFVTAARTGEVSLWSVSLDQPLGTLVPSVPKFVYAVGFTSDGNCLFLENGDGKIQLKSRENPGVECYSKYTRPKNPPPELAGYRLLHQAQDRDNQLTAVTGMSLGSSNARHAVIAIYNRENGKPVAVWKVPRTNYAGWTNWSHDGSKLAVPLSNGFVHVLKRPELDTWQALIAYAERAAKPALLKADVERLELLDVDEVIRLAN